MLINEYQKYYIYILYVCVSFHCRRQPCQKIVVGWSILPCLWVFWTPIHHNRYSVSERGHRHACTLIFLCTVSQLVSVDNNFIISSLYAMHVYSLLLVLFVSDVFFFFFHYYYFQKRYF